MNATGGAVDTITVYRLSAGLSGGFMTSVADYDDLSGECLTDVHEALRAGLVIFCEPLVTTMQEYSALEALATVPFLQRYAVAVLADSFMTPEDRDWLMRKGLIENAPAKRVKPAKGRR